MQVSTGQTFISIATALDAGVPEHDLVEVRGTPEQVQELSRSVQVGAAERAKRQARRKQQRASRKRNR